jgi:hypothetical protein
MPSNSRSRGCCPMTEWFGTTRAIASGPAAPPRARPEHRAGAGDRERCDRDSLSWSANALKRDFGAGPQTARGPDGGRDRQQSAVTAERRSPVASRIPRATAAYRRAGARVKRPVDTAGVAVDAPTVLQNAADAAGWLVGEPRRINSLRTTPRLEQNLRTVALRPAFVG